MKYEEPLNICCLSFKFEKLDFVHRWRALTGIELIHRELSLNELERVFKNWKLMNPLMKKISDKKPIELFGITNVEHYELLKFVFTF